MPGPRSAGKTAIIEPMTRAALRLVVAPILLSFPGASGAQLHLGVDATFGAPYVWRGVTRANGAVLQPGGLVGVQVGQTFVSAGAWASYELHAAGPEDFTEIGPGRRGLAQVDYWAQAAVALGAADVTLGTMRYTYRGEVPGASRTAAENTTELYARFRATAKYIVPEVTVWLDVDHVRGAYVEAGATVPLLANPLARPFATLLTSATLGYNRDGLTHVDLATATSVTLRPLGWPTTLSLEGHLQFSSDPLTRPTSAAPQDADRAVKLWLVSALRIARPVAR